MARPCFPVSWPTQVGRTAETECRNPGNRNENQPATLRVCRVLGRRLGRFAPAVVDHWAIARRASATE